MIREIDGCHVKMTMKAPLTRGEATFATEVCRDIDVLKPGSVEENLYRYKARGDRYAPVPSERKYIDIEENCTYKIQEEMVVNPYAEIETLLQYLCEYPFLLVDHRSGTEFHIYEDYEEEEPLPLDDPDRVLNYGESIEEFSSINQEFSIESEFRYGIISLSELNKRKIRDVFYPVVAEFEKLIAKNIKGEYPNSEDLTEAVKGPTVNAWEKNRNTNAQVHISEFMDLKDMEKLISDSRSLAEECGFTEETIDDISEVDDLDDLRAFDPEYVLPEIRELRNKIMHANRVFVHDVDDLVDVVNQYNFLCAFIDELSDEMYLSESGARTES